jgi:hypothetical protein
MSHRLGARIQELQRDIIKELEQIGIIGINFYFSNPQKPRLEYRLKTPERAIHCNELRENLTTRILANIPQVMQVNWYLDAQKNIYVAELNLAHKSELDNPSIQHGLLNLAYHEIQNHRIKFGI